MILTISFLVIGFILLIKGADLFVDGASSLATKMSISQIVIGLTVVAFGTSSPELVVNVVASLEGNSEITFGNIVGSNIVNILLILGIVGIIYPVVAQKNTIWKEIPFALLSSLLLLFLCNDTFLGMSDNNIISQMDGIILLSFFVVFLAYTFVISKIEITDVPEITEMSKLKIGIYLVFGMGMLVFGGKLVVENAIILAKYLEIGDKVIGLTIIAIGTSLPELVTSAVAAYKKKNDIAIGNIVGSNIFNVFFILGISVTITPVSLQEGYNIDLLVLVLASIFLFFTMFTGKRRTLDRWEAILFLGIYFSYTAYLVLL